MKLYQLGVNRPVTTAMIFIAVMVFGIFSYIRLPVDLFPEIEAPVVTVITSWSGASAQEVERNLTEPLENTLSMVPNLNEIYSESLDNASVVVLEFDWGMDMLEISDDVRDAVSRARQFLPEGADEPIIQKFDAGAIPVIILSVTAEESYDDLETILEDRVVAPMNRIPGVGAVNIAGAPVREVQILIDPVRFEAYHLDIQQVAQILGAENVTVPAGRLDLGALTYNLRTNSEFRSLEEIGQVVVAHHEGRSVYLHEVAEIISGFEEETIISRVDGGRGVTLTVNKQSDANAVSVAQQIVAQLPRLQQTLPSDVKVSVLLDTSEFITSSVGNLASVLFYAILFVTLVVLLFLHTWRATLIIAATIPVSLVTAFIYLTLTGSTLNIISLSSLAIALGMVVDDAIVVLENIMRRVEEGDDPREAAIRGPREVFNAVIASTLTVIAVFLPLTFVTGMMGFWFRELGFIVVVTMTVSTISALMLTPMMASLMLDFRSISEGNEEKPSWRNRFSEAFNRQFTRIEEHYGRMIALFLSRKKTVVGISSTIFIASLLMVPLIGTEFMPASDNNQLQIDMELATGRNLEFTTRVIEQIEEIIFEEVPELRNMSIRAGGSGFEGGVDPVHVITGNLQMVSRTERNRSVFEIADRLRERIEELPEIESLQVTAGGHSAGSIRPIQIHVVGRDLDQIGEVAEELVERMKGIQGVTDPATSRGSERPEFELVLDREKLAAAGLNSSTVSTTVRGKMDGLVATRYRDRGEEYDVVIRYQDADRHSLASLESLTVMTPSGRPMLVSDLGEVREILTPPNIERLNRERVVTVSAGLAGKALNDATAEIREQVARMEIPPGVEILYSGDIEDQAEAFQDLFLILLLSLILVYIVMAGQFESLKDPFVIMFSVPFALPGILILMLLTGTPLSVIGMLGGVILVGIVVKNGIVLVDYIRLLREEGEGLAESIVKAGILRLRPVLMTTLTTILAMFPMALSIGEGAEIWAPMGIAVIGGLTFSTVVTLGLIPVLYAIVNRKSA